MKGVFADYARFYDALYQDKDYSAEAEYFLGLVNRFETSPSKTILEFGAGSGGHQREFIARGFDATGVEPSQSMHQLALELGARVAEGDFQSYAHGETVDVVMALFHVVSYLTTDKDLDAGLGNARRHLNSGGLFVFDVWHEDAVLSQKPEVRVKRINTGEIEIVRIAEPRWFPENKTVSVDYTIFAREPGDQVWEKTSESHLMRYFTADDLRALAKNSGFSVLTIEETLTGEPVSEGSWGITAVFRADLIPGLF